MITNDITSVSLKFEGLPSNPNKTKTRHWAANYQENQQWKTEAHYKAKQAYRGEPMQKAKVHYHISVGDNRRHDADNLISSTKSTQDGLVSGGILIDDSIDNIQPSYSFDRAKPRGFTVTITKLDS